ncbi:MAG: aquaporin, partial [Patescibacteria group bacterium]
MVSITNIIKDWFNPWRAYLAEFIGTFVFVFVSCGAVLSYIFYGEIGAAGVAVAGGFSYATMMYATVHISGGHLNPAVTLASWLAQKTSGATAIFYVCAQIFAGIAAAGLLFYIFGQEAAEFSLGGPTLGTGTDISRALIVEIALSATGVFGFFATMVDRRGPTSFGPLVMGLVVGASWLVALP